MDEAHIIFKGKTIIKTIATTYSQRLSSSMSGIGESSSRSIELLVRLKSKLLDEDGGIAIASELHQKSSCLPLRPECADRSNALP
jgi:hypothetical protein